MIIKKCSVCGERVVVSEGMVGDDIDYVGFVCDGCKQDLKDEIDEEEEVDP